MKEERITITIDKEGNASLDVAGVKGKKCLDLTKELEEALGIVSKRTEKKEMQERPIVITKTTVQGVKKS